MKGEKLAAGLLVGVLATGCTSEVPTSLDGTVAGQGQLEAGRPIIDLYTVPQTLPPAVAAQLNSVVATVLDKRVLIGNGYINMGKALASGVRIGPDEYLTAGHLLGNGATDVQAAAGTCTNLVVEAPTAPVPASSADAAEYAEQNNGTTTYADRYVSVLHRPVVAADTVNDAAIVRTTPNNPTSNSDSLVAVPAAEVSEVGQHIYIAGYEPTADDQRRTPVHRYLSAEAVQLGLSAPAVYASVVVGEDKGRIAAIDSIHSYGVTQDGETRPGQSGGPGFVEKNGRVAGLVSQMLADVQISDVERKFGVDIVGAPDNKLVNEIFLQPVTPQIVDAMSAALQYAPDCEGSRYPLPDRH
jgi:hypothetical protein